MDGVYVMCTYLGFATTPKTSQNKAALSSMPIFRRCECCSETCENRLSPRKVMIRREESDANAQRTMYCYKPKLDNATTLEV